MAWQEVQPPAYDFYEIHKMGRFRSPDGETFDEQLDDPSDFAGEMPLIVFYALFGHLPEGGIADVSDHPTLLEACQAYTQLTGIPQQPIEAELPFIALLPKPNQE